MSAKITHSAMCKQGTKLCGYSMRNGAVQDFSTKSPNQPSRRGRGGQASFNGKIRKKAAATMIEKTTRRAKSRISRSSRQRKGAPKKKISIDIYGTISSGTYGMTAGSHAKDHVITSNSGRWAVHQFVLP